MENTAGVVSLNDLLPDLIGAGEGEMLNLDDLGSSGVELDFLGNPIIKEETTLEKVVTPNSEVTIELPELEVNSNSVDLRETLKNVFGDSVKTLIMPDEEGNDQEVSIDDITISQEVFDLIVKSRIDQIKEEEAKDKISVKKVSDFTKSLIEIDQNGGDTRQLLELKNAFIDPIESIDTSTVEGQREMVHLRLSAASTPEQDIVRLIKSYEAEGILQDIALKSEEEIRSAVNQRVEIQKAEAIQAEAKRKEEYKAYKKDYKEALNQFELNDSVKSKLTDLGTKEGVNGGYELDDLYNKHRNDPKLAAKLSLFLYSEEEYIGQVTNKTVKEKQTKIGLRLGTLPSGGSAETTIKVNNKSKNFIPLDQL